MRNLKLEIETIETELKRISELFEIDNKFLPILRKECFENVLENEKEEKQKKFEKFIKNFNYIKKLNTETKNKLEDLKTTVLKLESSKRLIENIKNIYKNKSSVLFFSEEKNSNGKHSVILRNSTDNILRLDCDESEIKDMVKNVDLVVVHLLYKYNQVELLNLTGITEENKRKMTSIFQLSKNHYQSLGDLKSLNTYYKDFLHKEDKENNLSNADKIFEIFNIIISQEIN